MRIWRKLAPLISIILLILLNHDHQGIPEGRPERYLVDPTCTQTGSWDDHSCFDDSDDESLMTISDDVDDDFVYDVIDDVIVDNDDDNLASAAMAASRSPSSGRSSSPPSTLHIIMITLNITLNIIIIINSTLHIINLNITR